MTSRSHLKQDGKSFAFESRYYSSAHSRHQTHMHTLSEQIEHTLWQDWWNRRRRVGGNARECGFMEIVMTRWAICSTSLLLTWRNLPFLGLNLDCWGTTQLSPILYLEFRACKNIPYKKATKSRKYGSFLLMNISLTYRLNINENNWDRIRIKYLCITN